MTTDELHQTIKYLREDLRRIDYAIQSVEAALSGKAPRGRPPKFAAEPEAGPAAQRGRQPARRKKGAARPDE